MNKYLTYLLLILAAMLSTSCERRTLYDDLGGNLYIKIELEIDDDETTRVMPPEIYAVAFYNPSTSELIKTEYVSAEGGYVQVAPGKYDILIYNFDTDYVQVRNHNSLNSIEAFTSQVTSDISNRFQRVAAVMSRYHETESRGYESQSLIYEPDHLYQHWEKNYEVRSAVRDDDVQVLVVRPTTIIEIYRITIGPVHNGAYVCGGEVFLTGMGSAKLVAHRKVSSGPATIWFNIGLDENKTHFFTTFRSFGRFPGAENKVYLVVHLIDGSGTEYDAEWDVTDQVQSGSHDIIIEDPINIIPPSGGGGAIPEVVDWDETVTNIVLC